VVGLQRSTGRAPPQRIADVALGSEITDGIGRESYLELRTSSRQLFLGELIRAGLEKAGGVLLRGEGGIAAFALHMPT